MHCIAIQYTSEVNVKFPRSKSVPQLTLPRSHSVRPRMLPWLTLTALAGEGASAQSALLSGAVDAPAALALLEAQGPEASSAEDVQYALEHGWWEPAKHMLRTMRERGDAVTTMQSVRTTATRIRDEATEVINLLRVSTPAAVPLCRHSAATATPALPPHATSALPQRCLCAASALPRLRHCPASAPPIPGHHATAPRRHRVCAGGAARQHTRALLHAAFRARAGGRQ